MAKSFDDLNRPALADPLFLDRVGSYLTCHARNLPDDRQFDRVRYSKPSPRLTAPHTLAQIESDVRDERGAVAA